MKRKFSGSGRFGAAKWARRGAAAVRLGTQVYRSFRGNGSRSQQQRFVHHAPGPITGESDYRGVYRRKPMPRRRKRGWIKFTRKVKAVAEKQVAPQYQVLRRNVTIATVANTQGGTSLFTILGANGGNQETDDIGDMVSSAFQMAGNQGLETAIPPVRESIRIHISGWLAEIMINCNGTTTTYLDCYYWRCKKDVPRSFINMGDIFTTGFAQMSRPIASAGPASSQTMDITDYGVTPFQCPLFSQCIQVYKKTRIKLAPGGTAQLELRSGKNYYRKFSYDSNFSMLRGVTEGIYFIQYGTPQSVGSLTSSPTNVSYSVNVNYTWRRMSDDRMTAMVGDD